LSDAVDTETLRGLGLVPRDAPGLADAGLVTASTAAIAAVAPVLPCPVTLVLGLTTATNGGLAVVVMLPAVCCVRSDCGAGADAAAAVAAAASRLEPSCASASFTASGSTICCGNPCE
jgi:hypothetical protein